MFFHLKNTHLNLNELFFKVIYYGLWIGTIYYFVCGLFLQPLYWFNAADIDRFIIIQHHQDFLYHTPNGLGANYLPHTRMFYQPISSLIFVPLTKFFSNYFFTYIAWGIFTALFAGYIWGKCFEHIGLFKRSQVYIYSILLLFAHSQGGIGDVRDITPWLLAGVSFYFFIKKQYFGSSIFFTLSFLEHGIGLFFAAPFFIAYVLLNYTSYIEYYFGKQLSLTSKILRVLRDSGLAVLGGGLIFVLIMSYYNRQFINIIESLKVYLTYSQGWSGKEFFLTNPLRFIFGVQAWGGFFISRAKYLGVILFITLLINKIPKYLKVSLVALFFTSLMIPLWHNPNYTTYCFFIGYIFVALASQKIFYLRLPRMSRLKKINALLLPAVILTSSVFVAKRVQGQYNNVFSSSITFWKMTQETKKLWHQYALPNDIVNVIAWRDKPLFPYKENTLIYSLSFVNGEAVKKFWAEAIQQNKTLYLWAQKDQSVTDISIGLKGIQITIPTYDIIYTGEYFNIYKIYPITIEE